MGRPKAWLPFGPETLLERVVGRLGALTAPIVVVAAPDQPLPPLAPDVEIARDPTEGEGPLQGIAVGLAALAPRVRHAFVSATDAPFLAAAFVARLAALADLDADPYDVCVPHVDGRHHPLAAVYATRLHTEAAALVAAGRLRPVFLFERARARLCDRELLLADARLRAEDPRLASLRNLNTPEDYADALRQAGLAAG
jgi:molybdopterin-guanine dinucleotide biosynthesis protein A